MTVVKRHDADFRGRQGGLDQAPHPAEGLISFHCQVYFLAVRARKVVRHSFTVFHRLDVTFLQRVQTMIPRKNEQPG